MTTPRTAKLPAPQPTCEILSLGPDFFDPVQAAVFPTLTPRYLNETRALELGLQLKSNANWAHHFGEFQPLPGSLPKPLALRYHGHQFRHYNPDLGDGRGFLFAQLFEPTGTATNGSQPRLLDLGTKGSGQTPFSRAGDGRLTLKGAFREALATEMLESLGVNTSKTFCFFETGESLERNDEPSPTRGAVLTRLSHSHIRFGTFQRLSYLEQPENLKKLVHYSIKNYFPELQSLPIDTTLTAQAFLEAVARNSAKLVAQWMITGFVHGVLNTDNMNITGESFDYGPYRFLPTYDPEFTAAYFDQQGLYCFGRQPNAVFWNVQQLARALATAYPEFSPTLALQEFETTFSSSLQKFFLQRLNLRPLDPQNSDAETETLLSSFYQALQISQSGYEQTYFDFFSGLDSKRLQNSPQAELYQQPIFLEVRKNLEAFATQDPQKNQHPYFANSKPCTLLIDELEALWKPIADHDDWAPFQEKLLQIRKFRGIYDLNL